MTSVAYAWIATIFFGIGGVVGKLASKYDIKNPWLYNFVWTMAIVVFSLPICLYQGVHIPSDWTSLHIAGFLSAFCGAVYIFAMTKIDVSILSPLSNLRIPVIMMLSYFFFTERLDSVAIILMVIITIAGLALAIDEKFSLRSIYRPHMLLAYASSICSAIFNIASKYTLSQNSFWDVMFWINVLTVPWILLTIPFFRSDIRTVPMRAYRGILASAFFVTLGMFAEFAALDGSASIAIAIISVPFSMLLVIGLSVIAPQLLEKHSWKVYGLRLLAATAMVVCALLLSR